MDGAQRVLQLDHPGRSGVVVLAVSRSRVLRLGYLKGISSLGGDCHIPLDYRRALVLRGAVSERSLREAADFKCAKFQPAHGPLCVGTPKVTCRQCICPTRVSRSLSPLLALPEPH